jgi:ABC-type transporter MlaC component
VYDELVDGVSAVRTYKTSFMSESDRHGVDSLTDRIAAKNRQFGPT